MANDLLAGKGEAWATVLQENTYETFVGMNIANTKFEGLFDGNDTVHFPRIAKITTLPLATSYSDVTIQNVEETDETFTLDTRTHFAFELSDEDLVELRVDPKSELLRSGANAFANDWDDSIMAQYANAGFEVNDGDMETATNGGSTNPIILSKSNIYDFFTAISQTMDEANMPQEDRWVVLSPAERRLLSKSPEFLRSTSMGDQTVRNGAYGMVDNFTIYLSNNLVTASTIKHGLAGQGKPICFASNVKPKVQITPSVYRESFTTLIKAMSKFGSKVFTEGANRLVDLNIKA